MTKLYLTLEDGDLKAEEVFMIDSDIVTDHDKFGSVVEDMFDRVMKLKHEELVNETNSMTINND